MALTATPGDPLADAYATLVFNDLYHDAHGNTAWLDNGDPVQQEAAIRKATAWLDGRYRWVGSIATYTQALGWPRIGAYDAEGRPIDSTIVPLRVQQATAEAALFALASDLLPAAEGGDNLKRIGPIEFFPAADAAQGAAAMPRLPWVDALLRGLVRGASGGVTVNLVRTY